MLQGFWLQFSPFVFSKIKPQWKGFLVMCLQSLGQFFTMKLKGDMRDLVTLASAGLFLVFGYEGGYSFWVLWFARTYDDTTDAFISPHSFFWKLARVSSCININQLASRKFVNKYWLESFSFCFNFTRESHLNHISQKYRGNSNSFFWEKLDSCLITLTMYHLFEKLLTIL